MQLPQITTKEFHTDLDHQITLINSPSDCEKVTTDNSELSYLKEAILSNESFVILNNYKRIIYVIVANEAYSFDETEKIRKTSHSIYLELAKHKTDTVVIHSHIPISEYLEAVVESLFLSNYRFQKHLTSPNKFSLRKIEILEANNTSDYKEWENVLSSVCYCRDLVNEPANQLSAEQLANSFIEEGENAGFQTDIFGFEKIKSLKMGGLLAVNQGSIDPPTFSILEHKPLQAINDAPIILVGKGVVYDTGGLSLKPTEGSMDIMKCDMAGAAVVAATIRALALNNAPVHVIGLIPATDNRPGGKAIAPGDIITMLNGKTVEVLNTDAEGRLILGDALAYASKYKPKLVIDLATLTGSAIRAIGSRAAAFMGNANNETKESLINSAFQVHERLAELPFWEDYGEQIKSDIADIKNIGGNEAGAITAGKFLEHFVDYEWLHIDIAGPSFLSAADSYRGKHATGFGVRLLYNFIKSYWENERGQKK